MTEKETLNYCIETLKQNGAQSCQCSLTTTERNELNSENAQINLLRTVYNNTLHLTAIIDNKKGTASVNKLDKDAIDTAINETIENAKSSESDDANVIAPYSEPGVFSKGNTEKDLDVMFSRMNECITYAAEKYPYTRLRRIGIEFIKTKRYLKNSNGVDLFTEKGNYKTLLLFSSKKEEKTSSFNYTFFFTDSLDKPIYEYALTDSLLKQSAEQIHIRPFNKKIKGSVIITPDCVGSLITGFLQTALGSYSLISGNSLFKDKCGDAIASEKFTLRSHPLSEQLSENYFFTSDGFRTENSTIIDKGILQHFLLNLYASQKTGLPRSVNLGGCYIIDPGTVSYHDMISSVEQGILLCRFSGGAPAKNGDFSGVAKNSYYIENGKIQYPINETMISGNFADVLMNIENISSETVNFGTDIFPWIQVSDVTISGK